MTEKFAVEKNHFLNTEQKALKNIIMQPTIEQSEIAHKICGEMCNKIMEIQNIESDFMQRIVLYHGVLGYLTGYVLSNLLIDMGNQRDEAFLESMRTIEEMAKKSFEDHLRVNGK